MTPKQKTAIILIIAIAATGGIVGGVTYILTIQEAESRDIDVLEIYHWWTSGGEKDAITALVDVFETLYPNTTVQEVQIAGGAGYEMRVKIKTLMIAGQPPDTFQIHAGYEWKSFYDAGLLEQIDDIWTTAISDVIPDVVEDICKGPDGHYYSVPVNIHRSNVVWFNYGILNASGIDPATLTTWPAFFNACDYLETHGTPNPVALGVQWTAAHAFEQILASQGIAVYEDWINGEIDSDTATHYPELLTALEVYANFTSYKNSDWSTIEWNEAIAKLIAGDAAFAIMGDWANGEFLKAEWDYGRDYGTFAVPGTANMYGLVIDCFEKPKNIDHPTNVDRWLGVIASKNGQDAFNPLKGSIAARTDANLALYGAYQQAAITDFNAIAASPTSYMFPSVIHGSGAPEEFNDGMGPIIGAFTAGSATKTATASLITALAVTYSSSFTRTWDLDGV